MDVWQITLAALRRWYVLIPLLGLTGFAAVSVGNSVNPEYQARSSFVYVYGPAPTDLPNPYEDASGANAIVGIVLNSVRLQNAVADAHGDASYEVSPQSRSTITQISTRADTAADAEQAGVALVEAAKQELAERQDAATIPEPAQIRLQVLEPPTIIAVVQNGKMRIQAVIGVLGAALSLLVAVLFDDIVGLIRRARAKGRRRSPNRAATPRQAEHEANADERDSPAQPGQEVRLDVPRLRSRLQAPLKRAESSERGVATTTDVMTPNGSGADHHSDHELVESHSSNNGDDASAAKPDDDDEATSAAAQTLGRRARSPRKPRSEVARKS